jgi:hypothetical protein
MRRTLSLRRETLAELTDTDLLKVAAGQQQIPTNVSCPVKACVPDVSAMWMTCGCATGNC